VHTLYFLRHDTLRRMLTELDMATADVRPDDARAELEQMWPAYVQERANARARHIAVQTAIAKIHSVTTRLEGNACTLHRST
jgi:hypothetical protein